MMKSLSMMIGSIISGGFVAMGILSLIWLPYDPAAINISEKLAKPSWQHLLGLDHFGRDILSMIMSGALVSLGVAFIALAIGVVIGVPLGLMASSNHHTKKRHWDDIIMRGNDLIFAFPALVSAIIITARFGPSAINAIIAIGIFNIPVFARITRAAALPIWHYDFILAARLAGKGRLRIALEHILPNIMPLILVQATIQFSLALLAEAGLSYIGLGVQPPQASWGRMLADSQTMIALAPHIVLVPGFAILLAVLGFNLLGNSFGGGVGKK